LIGLFSNGGALCFCDEGTGFLNIICLSFILSKINNLLQSNSCICFKYIFYNFAYLIDLVLHVLQIQIDSLRHNLRAQISFHFTPKFLVV
jgi:hypothetical protein